MNTYQRILLAADFSEHGEQVAIRARGLADQNKAALSVVHIVDNLPITDSVYGPVIPMDIDITDELFAAARNQLAKLGDRFEIPKERQWLEMGSPKLEIVQVAEQNQIDLIVVGSHGRHGLGLLLGSTANGVLHHAKCDVLAVRLRDD